MRVRGVFTNFGVRSRKAALFLMSFNRLGCNHTIKNQGVRVEYLEEKFGDNNLNLELKQNCKLHIT